MLEKPQLSRSQIVANAIRDKIIDGDLKPQTRLSEAKLCEQFGVSRNTLREGFRLLTQEGILDYIPNRGVWVALPDAHSIMDIYRLRKLIETEAIREAYPHHPALQDAQRAIESAHQNQLEQNWQQVGTANIQFHTAIVHLADSPRFDQIHHNICIELRLAFSHLSNQKMLHQPYIDQNERILHHIKQGKFQQAIVLLDHYLDMSLRTILGELARLSQ
ncbi:GntR family transcriptional regulator [Celerinatantimonas sp. YJH-8]|uniref:GntR family transcriptional regulator n=1 Tax=Celerinatantimonas sp. YJH-8 TaxID=3228714 RepID=UPI0038BE50C6